MARSVDAIVRQMLADQLIQIASLQAQLEELKDKLDALPSVKPPK